jgi:hypothetical protein
VRLVGRCACHDATPRRRWRGAWCRGGTARLARRALKGQERDRTRERADPRRCEGIEVETDDAYDGPRCARVAPRVVEKLALGLLLCQAARGRGEAPTADLKMAAGVGHQVEEPLGAFAESGTHDTGTCAGVAPYYLEHGIARPARAAPAMLEQEET